MCLAGSLYNSEATQLACCKRQLLGNGYFANVVRLASGEVTSLYSRRRGNSFRLTHSARADLPD